MIDATKEPGWLFSTRQAEYFDTRENADKFRDKTDGVLVFSDLPINGILGMGTQVYVGVRPRTFEEFSHD